MDPFTIVILMVAPWIAYYVARRSSSWINSGRAALGGFKGEKGHTDLIGHAVRVMKIAIEPRLLIVVGVGIALLGLLFGSCWSERPGGSGNYYDRGRMFCSGGMDHLHWLGIQYKWILGAAVLLILVAAYRFMAKGRHNNSN